MPKSILKNLIDLVPLAIEWLNLKIKPLSVYFSDHLAIGWKAKLSGDYLEDLLPSMLATTLGIPFDSDKAWNERKQEYKAGARIFKSRNICQSAEGNKKGLWTTVIAAAVMLLD